MFSIGDPALPAPRPEVESDAELEELEEASTWSKLPRSGPHALVRQPLRACDAIAATGNSALSLLWHCPNRGELAGGLLIPEQSARGRSFNANSLLNQIRFANNNVLLAHLDCASAVSPSRHRAVAHALRSAVTADRWIALTCLSASAVQASACNGCCYCLPTAAERHQRSQELPLPEFSAGMLLPGSAGALVSAAQSRGERALALVACFDGPSEPDALKMLAQTLDSEVPGFSFLDGVRDAAASLERADMQMPSVYS